MKYGRWLCRPREAKFFESPKILLVRLRNKSLKRRLVATYDDKNFFNRDNYNNIITKNKNYELKYVLALFNSSLLNYWYRQKFDNVNINPDSFQQLPIYPANAETQAVFVELVDDLLARHAELNVLRETGYVIRQKRDGSSIIEIPYGGLLHELQQDNRDVSLLTLYDARAIGLFSIPERCDLQASVSNNIYIPERYPTNLVLRHNKLWFEVPDDRVRRYLLGYLKQPQWQGKTWDEFKNVALIPEDMDALDAFFALELQRVQAIAVFLDEIQRIDAEIDERILDLYGITDAADRQRVLGSAPIEEETSIVDEEEIL